MSNLDAVIQDLWTGGALRGIGDHSVPRPPGGGRAC
jgi:hypothetical protein